MEFWSGVQLNVSIIKGLLSGVCLGGNTLFKKMFYKTLESRGDIAKDFPETPAVIAWWETLTLGLILLVPSLLYFVGSPSSWNSGAGCN